MKTEGSIRVKNPLPHHAQYQMSFALVRRFTVL